MQKLVIDGYNLLHADMALKTLARKDLQKARDLLLERITRYLEHRQMQVTLVFDGTGGITDAESVLPGKLQVVYSPSRQTADQFIVDAVAKSNNPQSFIVVTSDRADIGRAVASLGASVLSSPEFLDRLTTSRKAPQPAKRRRAEKPNPEDIDVDYWMKQFGVDSDPDDQ